MGCNHLRSKASVHMGIASAIMPDDDMPQVVFAAPRRNGVLLERTGRRIDNANKAVLGEVPADDGAPAVGSEMNVRHTTPC